LAAEYDLAGVVVNGNGTEFKDGDNVFGFIEVGLSRKIKQGALAQYVRMPAEFLVVRPPNVSAVEAAGVTLAGQTAYQALFEMGKLEAGQTVFINGGSSSVGAYAIQFAKARGIRVVASASGKNEEYVKSLGADEFIDYTKEPLDQYLTANPPSPKYHVFFDAVALLDPSLYIHSPAYIAPGGVFLSNGPTPKFSLRCIAQIVWTIHAAAFPTWLGGVPRRWSMVMVAHKKESLQGMQVLIAEGKVKPVVDSVFSFEDTLKAYDRIMTGRAKGKVVVKVDEEAT